MDLNGQRISTGIDELDLLVEGGFRAGRSYLIVGEPGTGKTIFGLQFLYKGLLNGEKSLYVAIDEQPAEVIEQAASTGVDGDIVREKLDRQSASEVEHARFSRRAGGDVFAANF